MTRSRRTSVARYHDRVAHLYDHIYDDHFWRWHDALTWEYLKPHLPVGHGAAIVDLGCGTGKWGLKLAHSGYCVTCVDVSQKMIDEVGRKVRELGLEDRVACVKADLQDLSDLPAEHFDSATAFGEPLCTTTSVPRALKGIHRLLRPGGRIVGTIDNRLAAAEHYLQRGDVEGLHSFLRDGRTRWLTKASQEQFELQTFTPGQTARLLEAAHFEVLELLGKTVLPMRAYRELLEDRTVFRRLLGIEKKLSRSSDAIGRAAHIQFAAARPDP